MWFFAGLIGDEGAVIEKENHERGKQPMAPEKHVRKTDEQL
jgi:hypothetical protein